VGAGEGELNLLVFAGYAEDGTSDADFDWVHPFERNTGCDVHVRYVDSGAEIVRALSRRGGVTFDGASVPADVSGPLIAAGKIAAVRPVLFRRYGDVLPALRGERARHYWVDGLMYGTPALYGPNLLVYDTEQVPTRPRSSAVLFDGGPAYAGRVAMIDSPMTIADAALYLARARPELGISDPYELTREQLGAATALLERQAPDVSLYWTAFVDLIDAFRSGHVIAGLGSPIALSLLTLDGGPYAAAIPREGTTGWADTWMMTAGAPHPNCMIRWMRWTGQPEVQAAMALWYGGAPSNGSACRFIRERLGDFGDAADTLPFGRCGDEAFLESLHLWRMPRVDCGDERGRSCVGYPAWRAAWTSVRELPSPTPAPETTTAGPT
jgi:putative spermidine/putrescine transport system substrate-binding protein